MGIKREDQDLILAYREMMDDIEHNLPRYKVALACAKIAIEVKGSGASMQYWENDNRACAKHIREIEIAEKLIKLIPEWIEEIKKTGDKK